MTEVARIGRKSEGRREMDRQEKEVTYRMRKQLRGKKKEVGGSAEKDVSFDSLVFGNCPKGGGGAEGDGYMNNKLENIHNESKRKLKELKAPDRCFGDRKSTRLNSSHVD